MDNLIPLQIKTGKGMKLASSQRCATPWSEFANDNMKTAQDLRWDSKYLIHSGDNSEGQGNSPFKDADMPLCQDILWQDYGRKQRRRQARQSSSPSSKSSLSTAFSPWRQHMQIDTVSRDVSCSVDSSGAPWSNREYIKFNIYTIRKATPIDNFWVKPEACYEALTRMANEVDLEPQALEDDVPQTSFWSMFQPSAASSATSSPVLFPVKEQDKDKDTTINDYESDRMLVAPPQQDQLEDQDDVNVLKTEDMLSRTEGMVDPATVYEKEPTAKITQEHCMASQDDTQRADLKQNLLKFLKVSPEPGVIGNGQEQVAEKPKLVNGDQEEKVLESMNDREKEENSGVYDIQQEQELDSTIKEKQKASSSSSNKQEQQVKTMFARESPRSIKVQQYNPQLATVREPMEIVVKLSDIIQAPYQPKLKLSNLIEPAKHQAPPLLPPRPRMTLADLM